MTGEGRQALWMGRARWAYASDRQDTQKVSPEISLKISLGKRTQLWYIVQVLSMMRFLVSLDQEKER